MQQLILLVLRLLLLMMTMKASGPLTVPLLMVPLLTMPLLRLLMLRSCALLRKGPQDRIICIISSMVAFSLVNSLGF